MKWFVGFFLMQEKKKVEIRDSNLVYKKQESVIV